MAQKRPRSKETEKQFLRRIDRTLHRKVKDGGPTGDELVRAIHLRLARRDPNPSPETPA